MSNKSNVIQFVMPPAKMESRCFNDMAGVVSRSTAMFKEQQDAVVSPTIRQITYTEWANQLAVLTAKHSAELALMQEKHSYWNSRADQLSTAANEHLADVARILDMLSRTVAALTDLIGKARNVDHAVPVTKPSSVSTLRSDILKISAGTVIIVAVMYSAKKLLS